jgi:peptidoglycan/xylan/chitin deacetylase (PgdA/CDA1 family)
LKEFGFGATFFISEFPPDFADTTKYMTWPQINSLHHFGFEIGNHTQSHPNMTTLSAKECRQQIEYINDKCAGLGITEPITFAYPGYHTDEKTVQILEKSGFKFARIGGNRVYNPNIDSPLLVPSWSSGVGKDVILPAFQEAKDGNIVVLTYHGVPDTAHPFVSITPEQLREYFKFLDENDFTVIALRDLEKYLDIKSAPKRISFNKEINENLRIELLNK